MKAPILCGLFTASLLALNLPLEVSNWAPVARAGEPVTAGIPLPEKAVYDLSKLRITDASGNTLPAQFKALSRWWREKHLNGTANPSAKWVLCDFQIPAVAATGQTAVTLKDDHTGGAPSTSLSVTEVSDKVTVSTGPLVFVVSKLHFNLLDEVRLNGQAIIASNAQNGGAITAGDWAAGECVAGTVHTSGLNAPERVVIEEQGPMKVLIRVEGRHYAPTNGVSRGLYGYQVFITAYAGKPYVDVQWALTNTFIEGDKPRSTGTATPFTMYSWPFKGYVLNLSLNLNLSNLTSTITGSAGDTTAKGAVAMTDGSLGLIAAMRDFAPNSPKAISIAGNKLSLELFPDTGGIYWLEPKSRKNHRMRFEFIAGGISATSAAEAWAKTDAPLRMLATDRAWYRNTGAWERGFGIPSGAEYQRKASSSWTRTGKRSSTPWETYGCFGGFNGPGDHWNLTSCFWKYALTGNPVDFESAEAHVFFYNDRVYNQFPHDAWTRLDWFLNPMAHVNQYRNQYIMSDGFSEEITFPGYAQQNNAGVPDEGHMTQLQELEYYQLTGDPATLDAIKGLGVRAAGYVLGLIYFTQSSAGNMDSADIDSIYYLPYGTRYMARPAMVCGHAYEVTGDDHYLYPAKLATYCLRNVVRRHPIGYLAREINPAESGTREWPKDHPDVACPFYFEETDFQNGIGMEALYSFWKKTGDKEVRDALIFAGKSAEWRIAKDSSGYKGFMYGGWGDYAWSGKRYSDILNPSYSSAASEGFGGLIFSYLASGRSDYWPIVENGYTAIKDWFEMKAMNMYEAVWKHDSTDITPPAAVADLRVTDQGSGNLRLDWTAPGGNAAEYRIKIAQVPIIDIPDRWNAATQAGWPDLMDPLPYTAAALIQKAMDYTTTREVSVWAANSVNNVPEPLAAGSAQSMNILGLESGKLYYTALVSYDSAGNVSGLSNVATNIAALPSIVSKTYRFNDTVETGFSTQIRPIFTYAGGSTDSGGQWITYRSLDPDVAFASWYGKVTGLTSGVARIEVSRGPLPLDTLRVSVVPYTAGPDSIVLSLDTLRMCVNDSYKVYIHKTCFSSQGEQLVRRDLPNSAFSWMSLDTAVAVVHEGVVSARKPGTVKVVANLLPAGDTLLVSVRPRPSFLKRIDFRADTLSPGFGWDACWGVSYSPARGFGFPWDFSESRNGRAGNALLSTIVMADARMNFRLDAPDGTYIIRTALGDNWNPGSYVWSTFGSDTICRKDSGAANAIQDDTISVVGDSGIAIKFSGPVCYLVVISSEGIAMDEVAFDSVMVPLPAPAVAVEKFHAEKTVSKMELGAYPNPFNPVVNICFAVLPNTNARYSIYAINGRRVFQSAIQGHPNGREGVLTWHGRDLRGKAVPSGFYFGRLESDNGQRMTHKLLLVR